MKRRCIPASALPHNTAIMVLSLLTRAPPAPGRVYGASSLMPGWACLLSSERGETRRRVAHTKGMQGVTRGGGGGGRGGSDSMPLTVSSAEVEVQVHERRAPPPPFLPP